MIFLRNQVFFSSHLIFYIPQCLATVVLVLEFLWVFEIPWEFFEIQKNFRVSLSNFSRIRTEASSVLFVVERNVYSVAKHCWMPILGGN